MVKVKNKRNSGLADKVRRNRKVDINKNKLNPFEVHINKQKLQVLGKKPQNDRDLPGVSRAKAIKKRKETLGIEMKLMNKTNVFIDKRVCEKNKKYSTEDKMIARYAAERERPYKKSNIYNLADDEIITHRGQTLEQIEKFDDPRSSDEDEDAPKFGGLDDQFVSQGHFGGDIFTPTNSKDTVKSHKDLIEQLIAESKKRKMEKQMEKEQLLDLTDKLDNEWKDLQPVVFKKPRIEEKKEESIIDKLLSEADKRSEDYDKMTRELKYDKRGTPSDALKSKEKQVKEEMQKLDQLEKERQERMLAEHERIEPRIKQAAAKHRSADDLDDNFELDDDKEFMLAYDKDGKPMVPEHIFKANYVPNSQPKFNDGISDTSDEDGADDEEDDEESDDNEVADDNAAVNESEDGDDKKHVEDESNREESDDSGEDEDEIPEENNILAQQSPKTVNPNDKGNEKAENQFSELTNDFADLMQSEEESDQEDEDVTDKIQSFFDDLKLSNGENLKELLSEKTPAQRSVVIEKLIKSYDPGLAEENKELLSTLFAHMLQYVNDIFTNLKQEGEVIKSFLVFNKIVPYFYDLAKTNKVSSKKFLVELLKEKRDLYLKHRKRIPDLDTLIFFKLVSLLYPTSDFRHPVTTPSMIFMSEILTQSKFDSAYSISRGLFIVSLILEYTALSKRYVPSAINFLRGILYLSANTSVLNPIELVPPFRLHKDNKILNLADDCSEMQVGLKMTAKDLVLENVDNDFKIRCLLTCTLMLKEFFVNCDEFEAQECIFQPHLQLLNRIDLDLYPKKVFSMVTEVVKHMKESLEVKTYTPMMAEKKRPKALRLYEPDVMDVFRDTKKAKLSERDILKRKCKKEMKGALREIRRDKAYIAGVKIREKIKSDNMRMEKVKQIYKEASLQQGELNKLKRMK